MRCRTASTLNDRHQTSMKMMTVDAAAMSMLPWAVWYHCSSKPTDPVLKIPGRNCCLRNWMDAIRRQFAACGRGSSARAPFSSRRPGRRSWTCRWWISSGWESTRQVRQLCNPKETCGGSCGNLHPTSASPLWCSPPDLCSCKQPIISQTRPHNSNIKTSRFHPQIAKIATSLFDRLTEKSSFFTSILEFWLHLLIVWMRAPDVSRAVD